MSTALAKRKSVEELVRSWDLAMHELKTGLDHIKRSKEHLKDFVSSGGVSDLDPFTCNDYSLEFDQKVKRMKSAAWRYLVDRIELKKFASIRRAKEIDDTLYNDKGALPDITLENIFGWLEAMGDQTKGFLEEAIIEVYNFLRPRTQRYATNSAFKIGKRVVLASWIENRYTRGLFSVKFRCQDELRALDNVFHMLDGKPTSAYRNGDLCLAIEQATDGTAETEYFKCRMFFNENLHLEFKRPDLVKQLNSIGGNALPPPK